MYQVFKRESYLNDAFCFIMLSGISSVLLYEFSSYLPDSSALMFAIHIGIWLLFGILFLSGYNTSLIISDDGIEVKYRKGGWSCSWSEIDEWESTIDNEGTREIKLTAGINLHTLPSDIIDNKSYRQQIKRILLEHCGKPTKVDSWMIANDTDFG